MKTIDKASSFIAGLALFGMLFGASNFLLPLKLGALAGAHWGAVLAGFMTTAVLLPLLGMVTITLFDGDYEKFFGRLGPYAGALLTLICIVIVGFFTVTPRIVGVCYAFVQPYLGSFSFTSFAAVYLFFNLLGAWHKDWLVWLLGLVVAPIQLIGIAFIMARAWWVAGGLGERYCVTPVSFGTGALYGFETLDLIGMILFGCVVLSALKRLVRHEVSAQVKRFVAIGMYGGVLCSVLFAVLYGGLLLVGSHQGIGLTQLSDVALLREIAIRIFGHAGRIFVAGIFFLVCYSTSVALTSIVAEYIHVKLLNNRLSYGGVLVFVHGVLFAVSFLGLARVGELIVGPVSHVLYPVVIVLTFCNLGYALWGLRSVKMPVFIALLVTSVWYAVTLFAIV